MMERDALLALDDAALLLQCRVDTARGRGPGGQKRNKTSTAVQITHLESGLSAVNDVTRSQYQNKSAAIARLRLEMVLKLRNTENRVQPGAMPGLHSAAFPLWAARTLDFIEAAEYRLAEAAASMNTTTSQLIKALSKCPPLWQHINEHRIRLGMKPLRID